MIHENQIKYACKEEVLLHQRFDFIIEKTYLDCCALLSLNANWGDCGGSSSPSPLEFLVDEPLIRFPACCSEYRFAVRRKPRRRSRTHLLQKLRYPVTITMKQRATEKPFPLFQL